MKRTKLLFAMLVVASLVIFSCSEDSTSSDTQAPTVKIIYPANNSQFTQGTVITISADATDNKELKEVRFYIDGDSVSLDEVEPYQYEWDTNSSKDTDHTIYAKAYDTSDNSSTSELITVTLIEPIIGNPPNPPSNPNPTNNATSVSTTINLSWSCTDPDGDPLTYDVYFGTDSNPVLVNSGQSSTTYDPGNLNEETDYYWKIIAKDDHSNSTTGNIWQFTTSIGVTPGNMIFVEGGTFSMGDHYNEGYSDELPLHNVTVSSFYMAETEVTQLEYTAIMGSNPAHDYGVGDNYPVYYVNWYDMIKYCNKKSLNENLTPCYSVGGYSNPDNWGNGYFTPDVNWSANGYRLPTEAEWEYAARGGIHHTDDYRYSGCNNEVDLPDYAWYSSNSDSTSHEVGTKLPNQLGLYDMSGNVWEWCWDWYNYDSNYYSSSPSSNPHGANIGSVRVLRGGNWYYNANDCRAANRYRYPPSSSSYHVGFRILRANSE